jgi:hypothetical protein
MILASKSKDNSSIILESGRQFVVLSEDISIIKNWSVGTELEVYTSDSTIHYNYVITNIERQEKIRVGIPKE